MSKAFSRRDFLKATAAAALAVSLSGALTGCGEDAQPAENEAVLGDFKIKVTDATTERITNGVGDNSKTENRIISTVKVTYNGKGINALKYTDVFSAEIDGNKLTLIEPSGYLSSADVPLFDTKTLQLKFKTPDEAVFESFDRKNMPMQLKVTLFGASVVFFLRCDGKNITIKKS